jgi:hypothetical protein
MGDAEDGRRVLEKLLDDLRTDAAKPEKDRLLADADKILEALRHDVVPATEAAAAMAGAAGCPLSAVPARGARPGFEQRVRNF